jgi:cell wall-associated NlpC family hydrolase
MRAFAMRSVAAAIGGSLTVALMASSVAYADDALLTSPDAQAPSTDAVSTDAPSTAAPSTASAPTSPPATTPAPTAPAASIVLDYGDRGAAVHKLERRIKLDNPNRIYGWSTVKRVKQIQKWAGLKRTGAVGPATAKVIDKFVAQERAKKLAKERAERLKAQKAERKKANSLSGRLSKIVAAAKKYDGGRYVRGGSSPSGFDCSGYTSYVVRKALGKSLPHQSGAQRSSVTKISRSAAKPGDLIFFHSGGGRVYHVGIYAGGGKLYHSSRPGTRVGIGPIFSSNVTFGRVA